MGVVACAPRSNLLSVTGPEGRCLVLISAMILSRAVYSNLIDLAAAEPGPNQAYLQSRLYTTTEGLEALVRILGRELNITCRSCPADLIRSAVSCPLNCKLPLDPQGEGGGEK